MICFLFLIIVFPKPISRLICWTLLAGVVQIHISHIRADIFENLDLHGKQNSKTETGEVPENIILPVILSRWQSFESPES
jgi:hypothetical protein